MKQIQRIDTQNDGDLREKYLRPQIMAPFLGGMSFGGSEKTLKTKPLWVCEEPNHPSIHGHENG